MISLDNLYHPVEDDYLGYQKAGIQEMLIRKNVLLADDMGLGKTIQAIGYLNVTRPTTVLWIVPNNLRLNTQHEIDRWMDPALRARYDIEVCTPSLYLPSNFVIASYEGLTRWAPLLKAQPWDVMILDEAHYVKNNSTKRARAAFEIVAAKKIYMTGTPIVNFPHELFPLIHSLDKEQWPAFSLYADRFLDRAHKYGRNLTKLQEWLRLGAPQGAWGAWGSKTSMPGLMIRRLKKEVLPELPRKRRQVIELPAEGKLLELVQKENAMWQTQQSLFNDLQEALGLLKEAETDKDFEAIIESLRFTRKYFFEEIAIVRHELAKAKVPYVCDHIEDCLEHKEKLIVFVHHHDVGRAIASRFNNVSVLVTGETPMEKRDEAIQKFWKDPSCKLFVGSLKVTGLGLNLQVASHVIFAELDWVPGVITQAEDRCHRIGQEHSLLVQHLVAENSMDSNMAKRIITKQKSINKALNRESVSA